jgi:hypothetical protein
MFSELLLICESAVEVVASDTESVEEKMEPSNK